MHTCHIATAPRYNARIITPITCVNNLTDCICYEKYNLTNALDTPCQQQELDAKYHTYLK